MDEVRFGPGREFRLPSRSRRALTAAVACVATAGIVAGVVLAVTGTGTQRAAGSPVYAAASARPACPPAPAPAARTDLAALPAGMRPGALRVVIDAQFSGRCRVSR